MQNHNTDQWIPFPDGRYRTLRAYFSDPGGTRAVTVPEMVVEAYTDNRGQRRIKGYGTVFNQLLVELLEEGDDVSLWLDLGGEFKFRMQNPDIKAGKLFSPNVKSTFQFYPRQGWDKLPEADFDLKVDRFELIESI